MKVVTVILISLLSGCGTMLTLSEMGKPKLEQDSIVRNIESRVYSGTKFDFLANAPSNGGGNILGLFFLIDIPLSLVADTIMLPYTLTYEPPEQPNE